MGYGRGGWVSLEKAERVGTGTGTFSGVDGGGRAEGD